MKDISVQSYHLWTLSSALYVPKLLRQCLSQKSSKKRFFDYARSYIKANKQSTSVTKEDDINNTSSTELANGSTGYFTCQPPRYSSYYPSQTATHMRQPTMISANLVTSILSQLNPHKSPAHESLYPHLLMLVAPVISQLLTRVFDLSLFIGIVSNDKRWAVVPNIHEKGARTVSSN